MGLVGSMGLTGNMMLKSYDENGRIFMERDSPRKLAEGKLSHSLTFPLLH